MSAAKPGREATIAAVATAPGRGGIGVVRISGADATALSRAIMGSVPSPRRATRASFHDAQGGVIDEGLALYFPAPHSYTGEDVLELQAHGGPVVLRMLLARCVELGARPAQPGEFTRRAFLNDKLDLAQAEAVADVIDAASETAVRCAQRSLRGEFSALVDQLVAQLVELRMLIEATLDFPDEDIDAEHRIDAEQRLQRLRAAVVRTLAQAKAGSVLRSGLNVVIAGQPNVGKSSLLNRLAGEEVAIVTPIPGTTRDAVRQTLLIEGVPVNVIDTAGLRETSDTVEAIGIDRAWDALQRADLALLVVDARTGVTPREEAILARLPPRLERIMVMNKVDLLGDAQTDFGGIAVSAKTGQGIDRLRREILDIAGWQPGGEDVFMARERHLSALARADAQLARATTERARPELMAEDLRQAQSELAAITGEFSADDLLGEIFSRFCIGK
jgi:tRNA modification GTPase